MSALHTAILLVVRPVLDVLAAVPDPGQGTEPPGAKGITTILGWGAWCVFAVCVGGLLLVAGRMGSAIRQGHGVEVSSGLVAVLAGAIIGGSASAIIGAVLL